MKLNILLFSLNNFFGLEKDRFDFVVVLVMFLLINLTSETVQCAALSFQSEDDVHGGDCLSLCVFSVSEHHGFLRKLSPRYA